MVKFALRARAHNGGKNPSWTSYEKIRDVIERRCSLQVEDLLPVISFGCKKADHETEKKHDEFVNRMVERGYTPRQVAGSWNGTCASKRPGEPMDQAAVRKRLRKVALLLYALVLGFAGHAFWTDPAMVRPVVGVFGSRPFGLSDPLFGFLLMAIGTLPLALMVWHLTLMTMALKASGYRPPSGHGMFGMTRLFLHAFLHRNENASIARHFHRAVLSLGAFIALVAAWIMATERAGV